MTKRRRLNIVITGCTNFTTGQDCPFYRDTDPYPSYCSHPKVKSSVVADFNNDECPLPEIPEPRTCDGCGCKLATRFGGLEEHSGLCPNLPL